MKRLKSTLFPFLMSLMFIFTVGCQCSSDVKGDEKGDAKDEVSTEECTYSVVFQLKTLSDAFLDFGTLTLNYLDSDGQTKSINVTKDIIPGEVAVKNLSAGDCYFFELYFERLATLPTLTEKSYQFAHYYDAYDQKSDGTIRPLTAIDVGSSLTIAADKVEKYIDKYTNKNIITFSGTVSK